MWLIDYDKLVKTVNGCSGNWTPAQREGAELMLDIAEFLDEETEDFVPVRYGRWEWDIGDVYACTLCGEKSHVKEVMEEPVWLYCPNCGAKMDGGAENETD